MGSAPVVPTKPFNISKMHYWGRERASRQVNLPLDLAELFCLASPARAAVSNCGGTNSMKIRIIGWFSGFLVPAPQQRNRWGLTNHFSE